MDSSGRSGSRTTTTTAIGVRINYVMEGGNFGYADNSPGAGWGKSAPTGEGDSAACWHQRPGVVPNLLKPEPARRRA